MTETKTPPNVSGQPSQTGAKPSQPSQRDHAGSKPGLQGQEGQQARPGRTPDRAATRDMPTKK
jgi:hypothetical protein